MNSREEINKYKKEITPDWLIAFTSSDSSNIFITAYDKIEKVSKGTHKKEEFFQILKHEFVHKYFDHKTGLGYPAWLNEGLANYLSGKEKMLELLNSIKNNENNLNKETFGEIFLNVYGFEYNKEGFEKILNILMIKK